MRDSIGLRLFLTGELHLMHYAGFFAIFSLVQLKTFNSAD